MIRGCKRQGGRVCGANRWGTAPKRKSLAGNNKTWVGCSGSQNRSAVKPHLRQASIRPPGIRPAGGRNCLAVSARGQRRYKVGRSGATSSRYSTTGSLASLMARRVTVPLSSRVSTATSQCPASMASMIWNYPGRGVATRRSPMPRRHHRAHWSRPSLSPDKIDKKIRNFLESLRHRVAEWQTRSISAWLGRKTKLARRALPSVYRNKVVGCGR